MSPRGLFIITGGVIFVVVVAAIALTRNLENTMTDTATKTPAEFGFIDYVNTPAGYSIRYPEWWTLDASEDEAPTLTIADSGGVATISIETLEDKRADTTEGKDAIIDIVWQLFLDDQDYALKNFTRTRWKGFPAFLAEGAYRNSGQSFQFKEYGIFPDGKRFYTVTFNAEGKGGESYERVFEDVVASFAITEAAQ